MLLPVEVQVRVAVPPATTEAGIAASAAVGAILMVTAGAGVAPPTPVQLSEYVVALLSAPVD